jgi:hypothetical protein
MANTFKNSFHKAVGSGAASNVYAAAVGTSATIIGMTIANITDSPISCNVIVYSQNTVSSLLQNYFLIRGASIAPGGSLVPIGGEQKLVLEAGDYLQVNTSVSSSADVIVSILEVT